MNDKLIYFLEITGLNWSVPLAKIAGGEPVGFQFQQLVKMIGLPLVAMLAFLFFWHLAAAKVDTSLGQLPGPVQVWEQAKVLNEEHQAERQRETDFYQRQEQRNADKLAKNPEAEIKVRDFNGRPTFIDQIWTSLFTVFVGQDTRLQVATLYGCSVATPPSRTCSARTSSSVRARLKSDTSSNSPT